MNIKKHTEMINSVESVAESDVKDCVDHLNNAENENLQYGNIYTQRINLDTYQCSVNIYNDDCEYEVRFNYDVSNGTPELTPGKDVLLEDIYDGYLSCYEDVTASTNIMAADDDYDLSDSIDDLTDSVEDMQDMVEDVAEDEPSIDIENNIEDHYIAECESCGGIFISAILESDQEIDHVTGVCPLCDKETNQYLRWVIKPADFKDQELVEDNDLVYRGSFDKQDNDDNNITINNEGDSDNENN